MTTQTDRELLELAALAAQLPVVFDNHKPMIKVADGKYGVWKSWNPLKDDGDAFRLAVTLSMRVYVYVGMGDDYSIAATGDGNSYQSHRGEHKNDPAKATRLAITRAAAAIGQSMKEQK